MLNVNAKGNLTHGCSWQNNGILNINHAAEKLQPGFFKTSNYEDSKNFNSKRITGTGRWLLNDDSFERWKAGEQDDLLWISGGPGTGKSVLSRALIDEDLASENGPTICYFFFNCNGGGLMNDPTTALCALIHQIVWRRNDLFQRYAIPAFSKCEESLKTNFEELWNVFTSIATDETTGDLVCILDALDECRQNEDPSSREIGRDRLIERLVEFCRHSDGSVRRSSVKFLVTSRPYIEIENGFRSLTKENPSIRLDGLERSMIMSNDLETFIDAKIKEISLSEDLRTILKTQLSKTAGQSFLWVSLVLEEVRRKIPRGKTATNLLRIIKTLPTSIDEAYESILRICDEKGTAEEAKRILQFVIAATRPLSVEELDEALEVDPDSASWERQLQFGDREESIQVICGLFVRVVGSCVYLIHPTARDFLLQTDVSSASQPWKHSINLQEANNALANKCVACLLLTKPQRRLPPDVDIDQAWDYAVVDLGRRKFLDYAARYWNVHIQKAGPRSPEWIARTAELCDIGETSRCSWLTIHRMQQMPSHKTHALRYLGTWVDNQSNFSALFWATLFELVDETRYLLERSSESNQQYYDLDVAFRVAISSYTYGEKLTQIFLEEKGDEIKITEEYLAEAASNQGCGDRIIALLLDKSNVQVKISKKVLAQASFNQGRGDKIIELLLDRTEIQIEFLQMVLVYAAYNKGRGEEILMLLLDRQGDQFEVPEGVVHAAASNSGCGDKIMALLMKRRAPDIDITENLILRAVGNRGKGAEIIKLLLDERGPTCKISERILVTVAKNHTCGVAIMKLLLEERINEVQITEPVIEAAVENWNGLKLMKMLREKKGHEIEITKNILRIAEENFRARKGSPRNEEAIYNLVLEMRNEGASSCSGSLQDNLN